MGLWDDWSASKKKISGDRKKVTKFYFSPVSKPWYREPPRQPAAGSQTGIQIFEFSNLHPNQWCNYTSGNTPIGLSFLGTSDFREKEVGCVLVSTIETHSCRAQGLHCLHLQASEPRNGLSPAALKCNQWKTTCSGQLLPALGASYWVRTLEENYLAMITIGCF